MKKTIFLLIMVSLVFNLFAQEEVNTDLTGILSIDNKMAIENSEMPIFIMPDETVQNKKSPALAGIMSFVVPGSGEIYNGDYWKAAAFLAAEVTLIYLNTHYNKKGDDKTAEFENYAHSNWSVRDYAEWSMKRFGLYDEWSGRVLDPNSEHGVNWNELNNLENYIGSTEQGKFYSHHLAPFGDQQYYEMIGKYTQFVAGWGDFDRTNLNYSFGDGITDMFRFYKGERGKANDFYDTASTMTTVIIVNHIISGIDAILSANSINKNFEVKAKVANRNFGLRNVYYPEINLRLSI